MVKMTGYQYRKYIGYKRLVSISNGMVVEVKKCKWPSIVVIFWIISVMLVLLIYLIDISQLQSFTFNKISDLAKFPELPKKYSSLNGYLINTPGCRIPEMNPFDPSVQTFVFKPGEIMCNKKIPPLFESNLTSLFMITEYLPLYNVTNTTDLNCCYTEFWRKEPAKDQPDSQVSYSKNCIPLNDTAVPIKEEFIKVMCKDNKDKKIYEDYFSFVPLKKEVEHRTSSGIKPNILVLGIDAVSRVNLHRQLPKSYNYLTKELGAVELLGYNKVADNTFPNLIPVLTGMFQSELKNSCWPSTSSRFDNCSFLWGNFSKNNYLTALGEDCAWMGIFNYLKKGFFKQPTDYYYNNFDREIESQIGKNKDFNCEHCVGGRETYKVTLDYVRKFALRMKLESIPYFGFYWSSSLSHDYLNRPALGDETYYDLLNYLRENGHLENTILVLMSDHGIRWGDIRQTYQGQMEERLPFVFMVLPKWFKENYPTALANLNKNIRRLTTPFDLHETLKDLLNLNDLNIARKRFKISRGYSLFNEIPTNRTCEDAAIDSHWCTCQQSIEIMTNDTQVVAAADFAVNNINSQLDGYAQCATLVLDSILNARVLYYDSEHFTDNKCVKDYTIALKTMPGEAVFEVTVRYKENQQVLTTQNTIPSTKILGYRVKMTGYQYRKHIAYEPLVSISNGMVVEVKKCKWPSIVVIFWIVNVMLVLLIYLTDFCQLRSFTFNKIAELAKYPELPKKYSSFNGYLINTPGCGIPEMNPFDPSIKIFIFNPAEIICNKNPPLFESNLTSIFMITYYLPFYNVTNTTDLNCCYTEFWRKEPAKNQQDSQVSYSKNCIPLNDTAVPIKEEFIKVMCKDNRDKKIYEDYFSFVPLKKEVKHRTSKGVKPNILVLGIDSVSRVNFHRQVPKTYEYLTKELGGVELLGYNKIADNTFPNIIPVLTGMFQSELEKNCWPSTSSRFDNCNFLWKNFSKNNYVTALGEDCAWMGIFNLQRRGFFKQPTDYYYNNFEREIESQIGQNKDLNCVYCVGGRETYKVTLDYIRKFVLRMKLESIPYFGFFWSSSLSHDYLNRPALGDETYYEFLNYLKENGHLENTILVFMSDHGMRWGDIRQTYQGQMEESLPFVFMILPKWFKENYPTALANLNKNIRRLTTPFDLHETLKDLLNLNDLNITRKRFKISRGYSLFNEIPTNRTCKDAAIDSHWCTCQQSIEIRTNNAQVVAAAEFAVNTINLQLDGYAQCATLVLDSILNARVFYYDSEHFTDNKSVKDYTIALKTMPGEAVFEVTVRNKENQQVLTTKNITPSAKILRYRVKMTGYNYRKYIAYEPLLSISNGMEVQVKKCKWSSIVVIFWIIIVMLALVIFTDFSQLQSFTFNKIAELGKFPELPKKYSSLNGYLINMPGCRIPEMNPFDPSVKTFVFKPGEIICNKKIPPLFESNLTSLFMITEYLPLYNVTNTTDLNCCYTEFWRKEPAKDHPDSQVSYSKNCIPLNNTAVPIKEEFIKVICKDNEDKKIYEDYFSFVPLKKRVEHRTSNGIKPNILVLGIDAVSRLNLHRQLPKTYKYLTKELGAVELLGYNKVADNTFPNLIPVLTGMFQSELKKSCWPSTSSRFDNCSFLWRNFSKNNYLTALGEDCAWMGIFNYQKKGFFKQPTDYYYTTFDREIETQIGQNKDFNCAQCVGGRETYKVTLDYVRKFVLRMKLESTPYFGFFWGTTLSHDYLNRPALGDATYYDFLNYLKKNGHLENTILILMSDHGIRWGGIRQTYQGQMEERLPFVLMILPKWFKENYPTALANLNKNIRRLTTPFDLHETLKDFLDLNNLNIARKTFNISRGYSLFNEIPTNRTCEDAAIDSHWCTCQQSIEIMTNGTQVVAAAEFAVNNINSQLDGYAQCATLVLDSILNARVLYYDSKHFTDNKSVKDYTIALKTMPGEAVFEVTVRYKENQQLITTQNTTPSAVNQWTNFSITGTVSRLNLYGSQSYCITDFHLKLYCYCNSLIKL